MEDKTAIDEESPAIKDLSRSKAWLSKLAAKANYAETAFLTILRYVGLVVAAVALVSAAILLALGALQQLGRTRVDPELVTLASKDVIPPRPEVAQGAPAAAPKKAGISQAVRELTSSIYRRKFKGYQREDSKITDQEVVDYVWSSERIEKFDALANQGLKGRDGKSLADRNTAMLDALALVEEAAIIKDFNTQLRAYRNAKKVNVCTEVAKTRSRIVTAWDNFATSCPGWYNDPIGCPTTRVIEEPFVENVCTMKFPEELRSPAQQLAEAVQRYVDTAESKLASSRFAAEEQTARNQARKLGGIGRISTAGTLFLIFLGVMFLYLFVALERHHRSLQRMIEKTHD